MNLRFLSFFVLLFCFTSAQADIGETFDMKNKREQLVNENEKLLNGRHIDSLSAEENSSYVENLHIIKLIDEDIFKSQETTIKRLSGTSGNDQYVNKSVALLSFLLAIAVALSFYMLFLMNNRLNKLTNEQTTFSARVKELFAVVLVNFQGSQNSKKEVAVNRLIILGMLFMFISFLGYLLQTLGV